MTSAKNGSFCDATCRAQASMALHILVEVKYSAGGGDDPQATTHAVKIMQFVLQKCEFFFITKTSFYFENKNIFVDSDA
jgi:hypothetical protein